MQINFIVVRETHGHSADFRALGKAGLPSGTAARAHQEWAEAADRMWTPWMSKAAMPRDVVIERARRPIHAESAAATWAPAASAQILEARLVPAQPFRLDSGEDGLIANPEDLLLFVRVETIKCFVPRNDAAKVLVAEITVLAHGHRGADCRKVHVGVDVVFLAAAKAAARVCNDVEPFCLRMSFESRHAQ